MNIRFSYLYRDGNNYKQFNEIIFANPFNREVKEIELLISQKLYDGVYFVANEWNVPTLFFSEYMWNNEVDHNWHEYYGIIETEELITESNTIEDFLFLVRESKLLP